MTFADNVRTRLRRVSMELSAQVGKDPLVIMNWFVKALEEALSVDFVATWLIRPDERIRWRCGAADRLTNDQVLTIVQHLRTAEVSVGSPKQGLPGPISECLVEAGASLAVLKTHGNLTGLMLLGRRGQELGDEETNAVLFLVEQLAVTVDNSLLAAERLAAERRVLQNDKLSALGLLASSIAHEVKNPLSAIKTIANVLAEELGQGHSHAADINLILGEVDRLTRTTNQLLQLARPCGEAGKPGKVGEILTRTVNLLSHLARQQSINLQLSLAEDLPDVQADEASLGEIFFNLLSNSLEAAGPGGSVTVRCHRSDGCVITEIGDNGPGISEEVLEHLFAPFLTTKVTGTGLGLYVVGRRVAELGGEISCVSGPQRGTTFTIKLPHVKS